MYICPICNKKYPTEETIKKHSNSCWRKSNPHYKSKTPPQGETIITKNIDSNILDFFGSFERGVKNDGKN